MDAARKEIIINRITHLFLTKPNSRSQAIFQVIAMEFNLNKDSFHTYFDEALSRLKEHNAKDIEHSYERSLNYWYNMLEKAEIDNNLFISVQARKQIDLIEGLTQTKGSRNEIKSLNITFNLPERKVEQQLPEAELLNKFLSSNNIIEVEEFKTDGNS